MAIPGKKMYFFMVALLNSQSMKMVIKILNQDNFPFWCRSSTLLFVMIIVLMLCKNKNKAQLESHYGTKLNQIIYILCRLRFLGLILWAFWCLTTKKLVQSYVKAYFYTFGNKLNKDYLNRNRLKAPPSWKSMNKSQKTCTNSLQIQNWPKFSTRANHQTVSHKQVRSQKQIEKSKRVPFQYKNIIKHRE